jgi:hypothetical protein
MPPLHQIFAAALGAAVLLSSSTATAQEVFVYPNKGQSAQQTDQDKYACYEWARQQSGYDPMAAQASAPPPPPQQTGGAARGAVRGAVGGAIIGEIADDDAGKGAAVGAVAGGMMGGMRQREANRQQQSQYQQQAAASAGRADTYNRAFAACLEGRGYTVR